MIDLTKPIEIPPIEGGFYERPKRVTYQSGNLLTVEYESGAIATGLILTGKDKERFLTSQVAWLSKPEAERNQIIEEWKSKHGVA